MKTLLSLLCGSLLIAGSACSTQDSASKNPRNYRSTASEATRRPNDKSKFRKTRSPGFGIDLKANDPYKAKSVKAPKNYKFSNKPK
ncbi:hypothetical protein LJY25_19450 [Hymenobacter sp. BT175]|uniref:hypothetical protein n=1 Tax=Hymenobacter translucens TaxID=2886507 RepID=UPI001D0EC351|nr:hypothetical protein [Hymenobacter translucens]MCC2548633.1 hypothetical protein [Hymenobacter translucens]